MSFDINEKAATNGVWALLKDLSTKSGITEIIINHPNNIYIERSGEFIRLNIKLDRFDLDSFINDCADFNKKTFDENNPILDGRLPDGSRINVISDTFSQMSPAITIRKYLKNIKTFETSPGIFEMDEKWVKVITALVHSKMNIMISGGTGVGKTTFLNLLLQEISPSERIITIEDTRELSFSLPNVVRLESRLMPAGSGTSLSTRDLLKNALRMRPDRIVIGEVRGGEVFDLLQAMNTGHEGSMASVHANSAYECLNRMENLYLLAGFDVPIRAIRYQIATAVDFIVQIGRDKNGKRTIKGLSELSGMEQDKITMSEIGKLVDGKLKFTGLIPQRIKKLMEFGITNDLFIMNK